MSGQDSEILMIVEEQKTEANKMPVYSCVCLCGFKTDTEAAAAQSHSEVHLKSVTIKILPVF